MVQIANIEKRGRGRPRTQIDRKTFVDLVGLGCTQEEICWFFRDETGKPISEDTLTRWCKREFDCNFADYKSKNGAIALKIRLRKNQLSLSEKSAAMAIWLGKQLLGQVENPNELQEKEPVRIVIDV